MARSGKVKVPVALLRKALRYPPETVVTNASLSQNGKHVVLSVSEASIPDGDANQVLKPQYSPTASWMGWTEDE